MVILFPEPVLPPTKGAPKSPRISVRGKPAASNGVARGDSWMDDYFKYSEVYGEGNEVESWSRNNGDGWSPRCFKSLEYYNWKID